jgi:Amt family ammonium transporter
MTPAELKVALDTVWTLVTAILVFWMNAGFGLLEAGLCRKKNATTILAKNFIVFAISTLAYWAIGFGLMFADGDWAGSAGGFFLIGADNSPATGDAYKGIFSALNWAGVPLEAKFFFYLVFAGTAATIVSGA